MIFESSHGDLSLVLIPSPYGLEYLHVSHSIPIEMCFNSCTLSLKFFTCSSFSIYVVPFLPSFKVPSLFVARFESEKPTGYLLVGFISLLNY